MTDRNAPALLWRPKRDEDEDEPRFEYTHANGRHFERVDLEAGYFVFEYIPNGRCVEVGDDGRVTRSWDEPALEALCKDPNAFFAKADEIGLKDALVALGSGFSRGMITYDTLADADQAVMSAIEGNHWLVSWSRGKALQSMDECHEQDLRDSLNYWDEQIRRLEEAMQLPALLKGVGAPFADSTNTVVQRLLAFRNAPGLESWGHLSRLMILPNGTTAWQLWCRNDPDAPMSLPHEEGFTRYPDPARFFGWIEREACAALEKSRARRQEVEKELNAVKVGR